MSPSWSVRKQASEQRMSPSFPARGRHHLPWPSPAATSQRPHAGSDFCRGACLLAKRRRDCGREPIKSRRGCGLGSWFGLATVHRPGGSSISNESRRRRDRKVRSLATDKEIGPFSENAASVRTRSAVLAVDHRGRQLLNCLIGGIVRDGCVLLALLALPFFALTAADGRNTQQMADHVRTTGL
jgi:hypothetical protein